MASLVKLESGELGSQRKQLNRNPRTRDSMTSDMQGHDGCSSDRGDCWGLCCADEQKSSPGPDRHGGKATKGEVSSSAMKTRNLVDTMRASQSQARCPGMG